MSDKPTAGECYYKRHNAHSLPHAYFVWKGDKPLAGPMQEKAAKESCDAINAALAEVEHEIMCHAACGVIAMSNTRESLATNRVMKPEYLSASVQDCIRMAEREIELQQQLATERETSLQYEELAVVSDHKIKTLVDALKAVRRRVSYEGTGTVRHDCFEIIDAALAKVRK